MSNILGFGAVFCIVCSGIASHRGDDSVMKIWAWSGAFIWALGVCFAMGGW